MPHTYELRYCECGETLYTRSDCLTKRCGKHWKFPEARIWDAMQRRCNNRHYQNYSYYGGRGIKVCERWERSFISFYLDMGPRPTSKHTIDRINVNGNYEPGNCRWVTMKIQSSNRRKRASSTKS